MLAELLIGGSALIVLALTGKSGGDQGDSLEPTCEATYAEVRARAIKMGGVYAKHVRVLEEMARRIKPPTMPADWKCSIQKVGDLRALINDLAADWANCALKGNVKCWEALLIGDEISIRETGKAIMAELDRVKDRIKDAFKDAGKAISDPGEAAKDAVSSGKKFLGL